MKLAKAALSAIVIALVVTAAVAAPAATAQGVGAPGPTVQDIEVRDRLIADQESLLNVYRCRFGVDVGAVPSGCDGDHPASGPTQPGTFAGTPFQNDVAVRDTLIANQEALLNIYRCQHSIDTQLVAGGCASSEGQELGEQLSSLVLARANELRQGLVPLALDHELSSAAQLRAQAQAASDDWQSDFDYGSLLEPAWEIWDAGWSTMIRGGSGGPGLAGRLSESLLGGPALRCGLCTHLGVGVASHNGRTYATVVVGTLAVPEAAITAAEAEMAELVNRLRASLGLGALEHHRGVAEVARGWSRTMTDQQRFEHNPTYSVQYPPGWRSAGENIAWNSQIGSLSQGVSVAFNGLVNSPDHYANMVNPDFTHIGVGIVVRSSGTWITQNFARY